MERTKVEIIADSVDDAVAQGLAQMGLPREMVDVEVMDAGSRGFLGIGGRQVRVRLTARQEGQPAPAQESSAPAREEPRAAAAMPTDELLGQTRVYIVRKTTEPQ